MVKAIRVKFSKQAQDAFAYSHLVNEVRYNGKTVVRYHRNAFINWLMSIVKG